MNRTQQINEYVSRMYSPPIKNGVQNRCFNKYGHPHAEYEDAFQVAVNKVYEQLLKSPELQFHSNGHLATYLFNTVTNTIVDVSRLKSTKMTVRYEDLKVNEAAVTDWMEELSETDSATAHSDEEDEAAEQRQRLDSAFAKMRPEYTQAIQLYASGMSYAEGAATMGVGLNTFKQYIFHGRKQAKELLGGRW